MRRPRVPARGFFLMMLEEISLLRALSNIILKSLFRGFMQGIQGLEAVKNQRYDRKSLLPKFGV